jgi:glyoxylase-like metal-dependent hydrolase (beta-lactamase superfamily II)
MIGMRLSSLCAVTALLLCGAEALAQAPPPHPAPPRVEPIGKGVWLIQGLRIPGRQPDGNSIIWQGPKGLVVMDTGRHPWHQRAIVDFVHSRHGNVVAIVNSHWHLDHVSGNPVLKAEWPDARVYASDAIDDAITGFLARSAADGRKYLDDKSLPPETLEDLKADLATTDHADRLKPDVVVAASGPRVLAGLKLELRLAKNAATDGDVWVFDPRSGVVAAGDLITLPVPYLDTACPKGWSQALAEVEAAPFELAVPGHGKPMSRADFGLYRKAFDAFIACAGSDRPAADCGQDWSRNAAALLEANGMDAKRAAGFAAYYVSDVLRAHGGKSAACKTA